MASTPISTNVTTYPFFKTEVKTDSPSLVKERIKKADATIEIVANVQRDLAYFDHHKLYKWELLEMKDLVYLELATTNETGGYAQVELDKSQLWDRKNKTFLFNRSDNSTTLLQSPDKRFFLIAFGNLLELWDVENKNLLHTFNHQHPISALALSSDGAFLLSGDEAGNIKYWSVKDGVLQADFKTKEPILNIVFSAQGDSFLGQQAGGKSKQYYLPQAIYNNYADILAERNREYIVKNQSISIDTLAAKYGVVTGDGVRMRSIPAISDDSDIITQLNKGTSVLIRDEIIPEGEQIPWYYISHERKTGWMRSDYINKE